MSDYITLLGAEQVANAANTMRGAADEMQRAAANIEGSLERFLIRFEHLVERLEAIDREDNHG